MQIRRPLAALLLAAALAGGAGSLTGCIAPSAGRTGTPADNASTTPGGSPASDSLPDNSGREITTGGRTGGNNG
jgi:hypothetical protein